MKHFIIFHKNSILWTEKIIISAYQLFHNYNERVRTIFNTLTLFVFYYLNNVSSKITVVANTSYRMAQFTARGNLTDYRTCGKILYCLTSE